MQSATRSRPQPKRIILTGWAVIVGGALMAGSLLYVMAFRALDAEVLKPVPSISIESRKLRFEERPDGTLAIYDAAAGAAAAAFHVIAPEKSGFIRGTMRALHHGRRINRASDTTPFELIRWADGRLSLTDTADGREIALEAFGPTNAAEFSKLLALGRSPKTDAGRSPKTDAGRSPQEDYGQSPQKQTAGNNIPAAFGNVGAKP